MDEQPNLQSFVNEISSFSDDGGAQSKAVSAAASLQAIGEVVEIAGSGSRIRMDGAVLASLHNHSDPSVAMAGQVGSQIKMSVVGSWLIASVRTRRAAKTARSSPPSTSSAKAIENHRPHSSFRRGVTRYPIPGALVFPVDAGSPQMYAATSPHVEIGTVYPTSDIRAGTLRRRRCSASISRCSARPAPASRPAPR